MSLGWKSITGSVIFGLGFLCKGAAFFFPAYAVGLNSAGDALIALGGALGGIGLRLAIKNK